MVSAFTLVTADAETRASISPQIYAQVNGYLTGSISAPRDRTIVTAYSRSGKYALVSWAGLPLGLDTGGEVLLSNASGHWLLVHGTGGGFLVEDLEADGVDAADAKALVKNRTTVATPNTSGRR